MRYKGSQEPYVELLFVQASFPNPSRIGFLSKQRPFLAFHIATPGLFMSRLGVSMCSRRK